MEIVLPLLYTTLVQYRMTAESFTFDISYDYSESVLPLMAYLSVFHFPDLFQSRAKPVSLDSFELLCRQIARDNAYYEECELHFMLFTAYYFTLRDDMMLYHLRKGMDIAIERGIALLPSGYMAYYSDVFQKIAGEYPDEYMYKIRCKSKIFTNSYDKFTENNDIEKLYSRISANDYRFVLFAANGLTNKQVGDICKLSERSVAKMYNDICAKLGFDGKRQLLTELCLTAGKKK